MFQPENGMQEISKAFARALGPAVVYNAPVTEIAKTASGVRVSYTKGGVTKTIEADYAVCAMPLTILKKIKADLDSEHRPASLEPTADDARSPFFASVHPEPEAQHASNIVRHARENDRSGVPLG